MTRRPRILLLAPLGWSIRNYVETGVADRLARHADVTVATPAFEHPVLRDECARRGLALAPLRAYAIRPLRGYLVEIDRSAYFHRLGTVASRIKWARDLEVPRLRARLRRHANHLLARALAPLPDAAWRRFGRVAYGADDGLRDARTLLDAVRPDLIFSTVPLANHYERPVLWAAEDRGLLRVTAITSWDNLSSKSRLPVRFDRTLVWGTRMRDELLATYPDIPPESVRVTGVPQFDLYTRPELRPSCEEFFASIGAPAGRPLVLYSGVPATLMESEPRVLGQLARALGEEVTLLYRPHPKAAPRWYGPAVEAHANVRCTPTNLEGDGDPARWSPGVAHVRTLCGSLAHASVNVNFASTMTLDAAVHDLPVVNLAFDDHGPSVTLRQMYTYDHYRPVLELGAARVADSLESLVGEIGAYLADRSRDRDGRRRLLEAQCGAIDGRASLRVAAAVLDVVGVRLDGDSAD